MIVVKLEDWPDGDESRATELGRATLTSRSVNDARVAQVRGERPIADYRFQLSGPGDYSAEGEVIGHVKRRGPWRLLQLALEVVVAGRR